ncbi:cyclase [Nodosilinea sp. LEGE 07088]|uniref:SRPBCC family protein n=1 Tax=Nodosilinea sp. LEGE 07088 TaxID=2777968 RepID=UPI00187EBB2F|nr:SRPBCC family protein [Nodosilinea sp. LEGE 07088]MBE9140035.1 cyclase [Nodosilinea sp. LEGE 07088]
MVISTVPPTRAGSPANDVLAQFSPSDQVALLRGDVLVQSQPQQTGGSVTAHIYVPLARPQVWPQVTNYSCWTQFFPNITHSEVIETVKTASQRYRRLYQVGRKGFMMLTAQVEIYLKVVETACEAIQFRLEQGTFAHFAADLHLQDFNQGTLLTYSVQAAPTIPVPSFLIEQAMKTDLPGNMRQMRRVLCARYGVV